MQQTSEKKATLVWWAKKDIDWIRQEASHRRLAPTHLIGMAVFDWFRENAQTKEHQTKKNEITLLSRFVRKFII